MLMAALKGLSSLSVQAARVKATQRTAAAKALGFKRATSEQQVLQLRHVDVPLVFRVFNQFFFLHEASHHCVCLGLLRNLTRPTHVAVVHSVHLRNEHLSRRRLLPSEPIRRLIVAFTVVMPDHLLWGSSKSLSWFLAKDGLFIEIEIVM